MRLYLAFIPLLFIAYQNLDREKEISGKYMGHLFGKQYKLHLKNNGKFVSRMVTLEPFPRTIPEPPHPELISLDAKKRKDRYKKKGSWVYFKEDNLDGVLLKTTTQVDSLYFLENGNLSPVRPKKEVNVYDTTVINGSEIIVYRAKAATITIGVEYEKQ